MEQKLIPFDLKKALAGEPVITRNGNLVSHIALFPFNDESHRVAVSMKEIKDNIFAYYEDGRMFSTLSENDLFMKPIETDYWVVSYMHAVTNALVIFSIFNLQRDAERYVEETYMGPTCNPQIHKITRTE